MKTDFSKKVIISLGISLLILFAVVYTVSATRQDSASPKAFPSIQLIPFADGFERPVFLTHANDGSGRVFVVEQGGTIRIVEGGVTQLTPFLDISDRVQSPGQGGGSEEGLLSMAFPPDFTSSGVFYVYYTNQDGNNEVARFHLSSNDPDVADPASEERIILFEHPNHSNHNGGQLAFGPDGYLYIGTGDGGGGGDPSGNAQDPASLLGKILRIDVSLPPPQAGDQKIYLPCIMAGNGSSQSPAEPYRIPPDNPFVNQPGYRPEIWALGQRNPWRFSFDRQTGDLWIGDVGQGNYEEVDFQPAASTGGENYGWNVMEGNHCYNGAVCDQTGLTLPVAEYSHSLGCSISGGYVYRGSDYQAMQGFYFYADYCSGRIWGLQDDGGWQSQELLDSDHNVSSFGEDEAGELYLTDLSSGEIYRVGIAP